MAISMILLMPPILYMGLDNIRANVARVGSDVNAYQQGQAETSVGLRLEFHRNALKLIEEAPMFGHGTGSFAGEYKRLTGFADSSRAANNPHNDYLWMGVELGLVGVVALLWLITATILAARRCAPAERWMLFILVGSMAIATLGNSFFTDHTTRNAFLLLACALLAGESFTKRVAANDQLAPDSSFPK